MITLILINQVIILLMLVSILRSTQRTENEVKIISDKVRQDGYVSRLTDKG